MASLLQNWVLKNHNSLQLIVVWFEKKHIFQDKWSV